MDLAAFFPLRIAADAEGKRLDAYLALRFPEVSRSRWARLIKDGAFTLDGAPAEPASVLRADQELHCQVATATEAKPRLQDLRETPSFQGQAPQVIYEDTEMLVLNKPVGLSVHPGHGTPLAETLVAWLLQEGKVQLSGQGQLRWGEDVLEEARPGIVHRLDRVTSGLIVVARNPRAHAELSKQFAERRAGRRYEAVTVGNLDDLRRRKPRPLEELLRAVPALASLKESQPGVWSFETALVRHERERTRFACARTPVEHARGKRALTHVKQLRGEGRDQSRGGEFSLFEMKLDTGRTHQIRVHLAALGFPILGDGLYGGRAHERVMLHARELRLLHPVSGAELAYNCPWPMADQAWLSSQELPLSS